MAGFSFTRALSDWRRSAKLTTRSLARTRAALARVAAPAKPGAKRQAAAARAPRASKPRNRFVTVEGVRLRYAVHGQGRPLVLIHGNGTMIEDFELSGIVATLARRYRVILFDRPGFGHSARPARRDWTPASQATLLVAAAARLKATHPIVVGHSWGAMVACAWALDHPQSLSGLVVVAGFYFPSSRLDLDNSLSALPGVGAALRASMANGLGRWLGPSVAAKLFAPNAPPPVWLAGFPAKLALRRSQLDASAADTAAMNPAATGMATRYAHIAAPTAILTGDGDRIVDPASQSMLLARRLRGAELVVLPGVGHMVHHSAPAALVAAIDAVAARGTG